MYNVCVRNGSALAAPDCGMFQVGDLVKISALGPDPTGWAAKSFASGCIYLIVEQPDRSQHWLWAAKVSDGKHYCLTKDRTEKIG